LVVGVYFAIYFLFFREYHVSFLRMMINISFKGGKKMDNRKNSVPIAGEAIPNGRVLVVDDKDMGLYIARGMLALYGLQIDTAKSGHEAIEKIKYNVYDLVLMDHMMPGMGGMETARKIRKLKGGYKKLPIVALTVDTAAGMKEMFLASGFNGFISIPIVLQEMDKMLKEWLSPEKISRRARANAAVIDEAYNRPVTSAMRGSPPEDTEQLREYMEKALTAA
jgi:CheY-like chemotaxis protein